MSQPTSIAADYVSRIRRLASHESLLSLLLKLLGGEEIEGWPSGKAFEHLVLRAFELEGVPVSYPYKVRIDGAVIEEIDGAGHHPELRFLTEFKNWDDPVGVEPINKLHAKLARRPPATMGIVFSGSDFTDAAKVLARYQMPVRVLLWIGEEVESALKAGRMVPMMLEKHRRAVEYAEPWFLTGVEAP